MATAPMTIVLQYAPSREAQRAAQRKLRRHVREARDGETAGKRVVKLQHDDMIDLTGGSPRVR